MGKKGNSSASQSKKEQNNNNSKNTNNKNGGSNNQQKRLQKQAENFGANELLFATNSRNLQEEGQKFLANYDEMKTFYDQIVDSVEGINLCLEMKSLGEEIQEQDKVLSDQQMNTNLQVKLVKRMETFWEETTKKINEMTESYNIVSGRYKEMGECLKNLESEGIYEKIMEESNTEIKDNIKDYEAYNLAQDLTKAESMYQNIYSVWEQVKVFQEKFKPFSEEDFDIFEWKFFFK